MPRASPDTTQIPFRPSSNPRRNAAARAAPVGKRVPTIPASVAPLSGSDPRRKSVTGGSINLAKLRRVFRIPVEDASHPFAGQAGVRRLRRAENLVRTPQPGGQPPAHQPRDLRQGKLEQPRRAAQHLHKQELLPGRQEFHVGETQKTEPVLCVHDSFQRPDPLRGFHLLSPGDAKPLALRRSACGAPPRGLPPSLGRLSPSRYPCGAPRDETPRASASGPPGSRGCRSA